MLDLLSTKLGLRERLTATIVATTGLATLSATSTGYARTAGSFLADGFAPGMEVTPVGFTSNPVDVLIDVTALTLTTKSARAAQAAGANRSLSVELPANRAFDGDSNALVPGFPALREEFVPAPPQTITASPNGGLTIESGLYFVTLFGNDAYGTDALDLTASAVLARFTSGTRIDANGVTLTVPWNPGPMAGQVLPYDTPGVRYRQLRIPWKAQTRAVVVP